MQIVTPEASYHIPTRRISSRPPGTAGATIGETDFPPRVWSSTSTPALTCTGALFSPPSPRPAGDIMGPFRFLPGMECRHGLISLEHSLAAASPSTARSTISTGAAATSKGLGKVLPGAVPVAIGQRAEWRGGDGHPVDGRDSLMGRRFTGCICVVKIGDKLRRLATYNARRYSRGVRGLRSQKGRYQVRVRLPQGRGQQLMAPIRLHDAAHSGPCWAPWMCAWRSRAMPCSADPAPWAAMNGCAPNGQD